LVYISAFAVIAHDEKENGFRNIVDRKKKCLQWLIAAVILLLNFIAFLSLDKSKYGMIKPKNATDKIETTLDHWSDLAQWCFLFKLIRAAAPGLTISKIKRRSVYTFHECGANAYSVVQR